MKKILSVLFCVVMLFVLLPTTASAESVKEVNIIIDEPVASYTPDTSASFSHSSVMSFGAVVWKENSPGFDRTLKSSDEFQAGLAYKAEIWLLLFVNDWFETDYYTNLAAKFTVNGKPATSVEVRRRDENGLVTEVLVTQEYDPLPGSVLSSAFVTGIPSPVAGQMPIYSFTINSGSYGFWHTAPVTWWDLTADREMESGDTFIQGHIYQLNIWLAARRENGLTWKLDGNGKPAVDVTLNSWAADKVTGAYEQDPREVIDIRYNFPVCPAAHTCAPQYVPQQDPTCEMYGFKAYYACSCGKCFEDAAGKKQITDMDGYGILPALGHQETVYQYDPYMHYKFCNRCGEDLTVYRGNHTGGTATCAQQAKCSVCGAAYGELGSEHRWGPKFDYKTAAGHAWVCADCKGHSTLVPHTPGPEATDTEPQKCTVCNYVITPAKNHTHSLTKVEAKPATCLEAGNTEYYTCSGCDAWFTDAAGTGTIPDPADVTVTPLGHTLSEAWGWDDAYHWRYCTVCNQILDETKLLHEEAPCSCGYIPGQEPVTEPAGTETIPPASENPQPHTQDQTNLDWLIIVLVVVFCSGISVLITVLVLKKRGAKK